MSKQSSLDWLIDQVHSEKYQNAFGPTYISLALIVEAEQMHKEEIENAYCKGAWDMAHNDQIWPREKSEQYYKETYGGNNEQPVTDSNDLSSPKEISDEEIEQYAQQNAFNYYEFITGAKWYREQLKKK